MLAEFAAKWQGSARFLPGRVARSEAFKTILGMQDVS
jgi:hypothetical protein